MLKHTLLMISLITLTSDTIGQTHIAHQDTIILHRSDTTFTFDHQIEAGQTLYSLAKMYKTTLPDIHLANTNLMETELGIGDMIQMPLNKQILHTTSDARPANRTIVLYKIQKGETLFALCKRWFDIDMATLKNINQLTSSAIPINTMIKLGYIDHRQILPPRDEEDQAIALTDKALIEATAATIQGLQPIIEQGKAIWKTGKSAADQPYILHRKAKLNSLVQIYNPMTGQKIHAKVVGRIPRRNYDENVMVVLTPYLANALKARDQEFFVKMKYVL